MKEKKTTMSDCACRPNDPCVFHASGSAPKSHNISEFQVHEACVTRASATGCYLADGTKIMLKRDPKCTHKVWIENEPQAVLRSEDVPVTGEKHARKN